MKFYGTNTKISLGSAGRPASSRQSAFPNTKKLVDLCSWDDLLWAKGASLAPMAGATDTTMRRLCAAHGAVCTVSEMVSAKALTMGDKKSPRLMAGGGGDAPFGVQLFGAQPDVMAEAARLICDMRGKMPFDFIDINMGCPAPKIAGPGAGSALLKDPPLAGPLPEPCGTRAPADVPVTVKLRIGWDADTMTA